MLAGLRLFPGTVTHIVNMTGVSSSFLNSSLTIKKHLLRTFNSFTEVVGYIFQKTEIKWKLLLTQIKKMYGKSRVVSLRVLTEFWLIFLNKQPAKTNSQTSLSSATMPAALTFCLNVPTKRLVTQRGNF